MTRRVRGFTDAVAFSVLAVIAIPVCLVAPDTWEGILDSVARNILFSRTK